MIFKKGDLVSDKSIKQNYPYIYQKTINGELSFVLDPGNKVNPHYTISTSLLIPYEEEYNLFTYDKDQK